MGSCGAKERVWGRVERHSGPAIDYLAKQREWRRVEWCSGPAIDLLAKERERRRVEWCSGPAIDLLAKERERRRVECSGPAIDLSIEFWIWIWRAVQRPHMSTITHLGRASWVYASEGWACDPVRATQQSRAKHT